MVIKVLTFSVNNIWLKIEIFLGERKREEGLPEPEELKIVRSRRNTERNTENPIFNNTSETYNYTLEVNLFFSRVFSRV